MNPFESETKRNEVEQFIHTVFDYYNGRINVYNRAKLEINWLMNHNSMVGAYSRNPNVVVIYPKAIYRYATNDNSFKYAMLMCIIHELYHQDQDIDYIRMVNDPQYKQYIENAVEVQTYLYIAYNVMNIERLFGVISPIDPSMYSTLLQNMGAYDLGRYHRCTYVSHFISMFKEIMHSSNNSAIDIINNAFMDIKSIITVIFDNTKFVLKNGEYCMPMEQLNDILDDLFFKYSYRGASVNLNLVNGTEYILTINSKCFKKLYSLI